MDRNTFAGAHFRLMTPSPTQADRRRWMEILARAEVRELEVWFAAMGEPEFTWLRPPETGLAMVRARAGGSGERFNLGEMTVTRCVLRVHGATGVAYVAGRSVRHAQLAAIADAMLQAPDVRATLERGLLAPLVQAQQRRVRDAARQAAATRVDFQTLVRGDGP
jgi:alpha-D-ribose 1-methylphosphonate 5-triphosphate synthase subunit PhnG